MRTTNAILLTVALLGLAIPGYAEDCSPEFSSTWELIQKAVIERHGCAEQACHGTGATGGLNLSPDVAYENLIQVESETVPGVLRIKPGRKDDSLFFINLAAKTLPGEWTAPLRSMPLNLPAISENELEAIRIWIEHGAPKDGVVDGTGELLDACLPPPLPIEIAPLPKPPVNEGVQLHMPPWILPANSETEVCFSTYYDVTGQVPAQFLNEDGTKFRYKRDELRQDPLSHHLIVNLYEGEASPTDPAWGTYRCRGGAANGQACNPTAIGSCGVDSDCAADAFRSIACFGYGPGDAQVGLQSAGITLSQETAADNKFVDGVYDELPLKGVIIWNSHAFNHTGEPGKLEGWLNFYFAENQQTPVEDIFGNQNGFNEFVGTLFKMVADPFTTDEVCEFEVVPPNAQVFELTSHNHRFGKRFRIFEGEFSCDGGPNAGQPCSPYGPDFVSPNLCPESTCSAIDGPRVGDCNNDKSVAVAELVKGVNIALGSQPRSECRRLDADRNDEVTISELVSAVNAALAGFPRVNPDEALMFTSLVYNDPRVLRMDPPMAFPGPGSFRESRTFTYCSLFDNGYTNPADVKRKSTSPEAPFALAGFGGPCAVPTGCVAGKVGTTCSGTNTAARNASCDSMPGAGDGFCDACTLTGGVTTEDEMFLLIGAYFIP